MTDNAQHSRMLDHEAAPSPVPPTSFPVLIVDDSEGDRRLIGICLGKAWPFEREMRMDFASDGIEALERVRGTRFALIVLDWRMPKMGGNEVLRALRKGGVRTPVLVLSGVDRKDIQEDLESFGAAFLNKDNMNPDTLRQAIATSLQRLGLLKPPTR